mgnify:CR=1 FL=1
MMTPKKAAEGNAGDAFIAPVIDLAHLDQYTLGDLSLQSELLHLFRIQLQNQAEELVSCSEEANWLSAVHTLKGAARSIGAGQVADVAEELELVSSLIFLTKKFMVKSSKLQATMPSQWLKDSLRKRALWLESPQELLSLLQLKLQREIQVKKF